jgi:DUF971 family protein
VGQTPAVTMDLPSSESPTAVELDREHGLTVTWADGSTSSFALEELRLNCPCAECRGLREQRRPVWPKPGAPQPLAGVGAELVGAWGLTITWNDGHSTGIFAWGLLRHWADSSLADTDIGDGPP